MTCRQQEVPGAADVDPVARVEVRKLVRGLVREVEKRQVDVGIKLCPIDRRKRMTHPHREVLRRFGLQEHVRLGPPQERQVGRHGPFRAVVGPENPLDFGER